MHLTVIKTTGTLAHPATAHASVPRHEQDEIKIRSDQDEMNPPNAYLKAGEHTSGCHLPPLSCHHAGLKGLKHASSLLAISYSSSEPHHCDEIDDCTNHSAPRHLLGVSLGPNTSYSTSLNPGLGPSICRGNSTFLSGLRHVLMSTNQLSPVPLRGEKVCLICVLTSHPLRFPILRYPVTPRHKAITINWMSVGHILLEANTTRARYLSTSSMALT